MQYLENINWSIGDLEKAADPPRTSYMRSDTFNTRRLRHIVYIYRFQGRATEPQNVITVFPQRTHALEALIEYLEKRIQYLARERRDLPHTIPCRSRETNG